VAHVALLLPWITAVVAARLSIRDNSFLWHVTAGRLQIADGSVLTTDPFSFTHAGESWRTQSWLLELGYGFFDERGGLSFVTPFIAVTATLLFAFILLVTYRQTRSLPATVIVGVLTAWLSAAFLSPRPVLVSYLLLAMVVAATTDKRLRWVLPLVAFVWAAVHGSFILGIGYVVLVGLCQRDRRRLSDAVAMVAVSTFTAHGWGVWQVLVEFGRSRDSLDLITEWATPDLTKVALIPFLIGTILLIVAGIRGHLAMRHLWIVVPFLVVRCDRDTCGLSSLGGARTVRRTGDGVGSSLNQVRWSGETRVLTRWNCGDSRDLPASTTSRRWVPVVRGLPRRSFGTPDGRTDLS
jgi:hypothetical protein